MWLFSPNRKAKLNSLRRWPPAQQARGRMILVEVGFLRSRSVEDFPATSQLSNEA